MSSDRRAWTAALSGMIALAVAMGIGRFVFTPLLPMMQHDAGISIVQGSWLASVNYLGYLVGALSCMWIRWRSESMIRGGLLLTAVLTFAMGLTQDFDAWLVLRALAGVASAWVLVFSSAWTLRQVESAGRANLSSIAFSGPGVGIFVTGLLVIFLTLQQSLAQSAWRLFGVAALLLTLLIWPALRTTGSASLPAIRERARLPMHWSKATLSLVACYGVAGFGYIIPATFLPLIAKQTIHSPLLLSLFWPMFGLAVIVVCLAMLYLPSDLNNRKALTICFTLQALGNAFLAMFPDALGLMAGTVLVGSVFTAIVQFTMREARDLAGENASMLMGALTSAYGVGQIIGPPFAGQLVQQWGSFAPSLLVAAASLLAAAAVLYPKPLSHFLRKKGAANAVR
jgi:predicted MFS family arabinose efflux permease